MDETEFLNFISEEGWDVLEDEVGDKYCLARYDDKILQIIPYFRLGVDQYRLGLMPFNRRPCWQRSITIWLCAFEGRYYE